MSGIAASTITAAWSHSSASSKASSKVCAGGPGTTIGYVTDIEGNRHFWNRYVNMSKVLTRDSRGRVILKPNSMLVFGGDVVDRGDGDIEVLKDLMDLTDRFPNRVHFILGNRDVNKMRLTSELSQSHLTFHPAGQARGAYWSHKHFGGPPAHGPDQDPAAERLKFLFTTSFGCPDTFEHRRKELARTGGAPSPDHVTDRRVALSFRDVISPGGLLTRYLQQGKLALLLGDTLFVHGAIPTKAFSTMPPTCEAPVDNSAQSWVDALNRFAKREVEDWARWTEKVFERDEAGILSVNDANAWALTGGWDHPQPGSRLMQYGMGRLPTKDKTNGVVYANWLSEGMPSLPSSKLTSKLKEMGVRRVITGHQPHGDAPVIMSTPSGVDFITADTSYSAFVKWAYRDGVKNPNPNKDSRGCAVSEVLIRIGKAGSTVSVHGTLSDGTAYDCDVGECAVGRATEDNGWAKVIAGDKLLVTKAKGFSVTNEYRPLKPGRNDDG